MQDEQPAASAGERAAAAAAAAQDDAGGSDYAAPEVEGVAGDPMEDLLAEFVRCDCMGSACMGMRTPYACERACVCACLASC